MKPGGLADRAGGLVDYRITWTIWVGGEVAGVAEGYYDPTRYTMDNT